MDPYLAVMNAHGMTHTLFDFWLEPRRESRLRRPAAVVVRS